MTTLRIAMSFEDFEAIGTINNSKPIKSPNPQVLIAFFSLEEDPELEITVSHDPKTELYTLCNTVGDVNNDGKQDDEDRKICVNLAAAFIDAMNHMNKPDIDIR